MTPNLRRLCFIAVPLPILLFFFLTPPAAADITLGIHGGPMTVEKGFDNLSFNTGYTLGLKAMIPLESHRRLSLGAAMDYCLMDGEEDVTDADGVYESTNDYKLADAQLLARYTLFSFGKVTGFLQAATGFFWEKTSVDITPLSPIHVSRAKENMGMLFAYGGGVIFRDHFELYLMMNSLEDNGVLTVTIGWLFND